eukprot:gene3013-3763_t
MNVELVLREAIQKAFQEVFKINLSLNDISLQATRKEFEGAYTLVVFPFIAACKVAPEALAIQLGNWLEKNTQVVASFQVIKGFLNLSIRDVVWLEAFNDLYENASWEALPSNGKKMVVEYSSPNTNKPLHLGHLRNNFLGHAVSEILQAAGYEVYKVNLVNDRGIHICKSMVAYKHWGNGETPASSGLKGDHLVGKYYIKFDQVYKEQIALLEAAGADPVEAAQKAPILQEAQQMLKQWEAGDEAVVALWDQMNTWVYAGFEETYQMLGITFHKTYYESQTYLLGKEVVTEGRSKNVFYTKGDGSIWIDLNEEGLGEKLLLRSDGTSVYITQDLGTADLRYQDFQQPDQFIFVVGNEQDYHFEVLQKIMKRLGRPYADQLYHLSYGMVDLPSGKMKSREGTVVDADMLLEEMIETAKQRTNDLGKIDEFSKKEADKLYHILAMGALKYFLLRVDAKKRLLFDPQSSIDFHGDTGPFIQYTHARIAAILRKVDVQELHHMVDVHRLSLHPLERELLALLVDFSKNVTEAAAAYAPAILAQYVLEVAKAYNRIYAMLPILGESDPMIRLFRLQLSLLTATTIKKIMHWLGIEVPDRM